MNTCYVEGMLQISRLCSGIHNSEVIDSSVACCSFVL